MDPKDLTNGDGLLVRKFAVRAADTEKREFTGLGVPYGEEIEHFFGTETFDAGSIERADEARILWQHREPIGVATATRETAEGFEITGRISRTPRGDEAMVLLKDGVIRSLSIGFEPIEWTVEKRDDGSEVIHWTRVIAREFSLVTFPAYESAAISNVRHRPTPPTPKGTPMEPETLTREALTPITEQLADLERGLELVKANTAPAAPPAAAKWRSMGDFVKALQRGDGDAAAFHAEYTRAATTADAALDETFVGNFIKLVRDRRRIINKFSTGTLPSKGMTLDYVQLLDDGTVVGKQANEGDNLPYGKVQLGRDQAPVETYGGYSDATRQLIERSDTPYLDTVWDAMGIKYGRETNRAVATTFTDTITANLAAFNDATTPDATAAVNLPLNATTDQWLDMIVDAAINREDKGYVIEGLSVSGDVFKELIRLKDGDNRLMTVYGSGVNQVGRLDLSAVSGSLANVAVDLLPGVTGRVGSFYEKSAIKTLESAGAPAQLQDENIINLTKQFSVYGYMAVLTPFPSAVLPVNFATA